MKKPRSLFIACGSGSELTVLWYLQFVLVSDRGMVREVK